MFDRQLAKNEESAIFNLTRQMIFADWVIGYAKVVMQDDQFNKIKDQFDRQWPACFEEILKVI